MMFPTMPAPEQLFLLQLELECARIEQRDRIVPFACPDPDEPHRVLVVRFAFGERVFFRNDLDEQTVRSLKRLSPNTIREDQDLVNSLLGRETEVFRGTTYIIDRQIESKYASATRSPDNHVEGHADTFVVLIDGKTVSGCSSSRENQRCAEAWVWTEPEHRYKGYGKQCVSAWAVDVQRLGKTPFYSHAAENLASRALAASLGLQTQFEIVGYT